MIQRAYKRGHGNLPSMTLAEVRQYYKQHAIPSMPGIDYQDIAIDDALMRLHYPSTDRSTYPVVIYFRASAYIFGDISDSDRFCHLLAKELNCVVVAIEPRLAPECKFPGPFEDALKCVKYLYHYHSDLRLDPNRFAVWGESSGGNLAAALSHELSFMEPVIKHQVLFYPMLDYSKQYPSIEHYGSGYLMDRTLCDWFMEQHIRHPDDVFDPRISPLLSQKRKTHPSTLVVGAQYDPMRDEAFAYIEQLFKAEIPVEALCVPGLIHGFLLYSEKLEAAQNAQRFAVESLRNAICL